MDKKEKFSSNAEVDAFKQTILKKAEDLVVIKFPKRIVQLNKMLSSGLLTSDPKAVYQKINIPIPDVTGKESITSQTPADVTASNPSSGTTTSPASATQSGTSNGETGVSSQVVMRV